MAEEGERAAELKESERFTVVIGNPPYHREQQEIGATGKRKGGVVRYGTESLAPLLNEILEPMKTVGQGRHLKNVYNDYVYFWRWAVWQATELPEGPGVVAFITASSYLDGVSMGGLRYLLRDVFDELWIVDLGGEGRGAHKEDNIFDILTPVAIAVGVRGGGLSSADCPVRYTKITGTRAEKLTSLQHLALEDVSDVVRGYSLDRFTPHSDGEYYDWPEITDLFPWIRSGCKAGRTWPIAEDIATLKRRWSLLAADSEGQRCELFVDRKHGKKSTDSPEPLLSSDPTLASIVQIDSDHWPESIESYGYRSFDRQQLIADARLLDRSASILWHVRRPRQVYLTTLTSTKLGRGPVLTVSPYVPDICHFRGSFGAKDVMPLYRTASGMTHNVADGLLAVLGQTLGVAVAAEDLCAYVYAIGGTPAFSDKFGEGLVEAAGPVHIPMTADAALFAEAVTLGRDLLWWHTWGERFAPDGNDGLPAGRAEQIRPVIGMPNSFAYEPAAQTLTVGTGAFAPISPKVWDFEVSGLKVLRSWLGYRMADRKGKKSSPLDDIRPTRWTQTPELLLVLSILEHTLAVTPQAADLLERIVSGPLIPADDLPAPTPANREPPRAPKHGTSSMSDSNDG